MTDSTGEQKKKIRVVAFDAKGAGTHPTAKQTVTIGMAAASYDLPTNHIGEVKTREWAIHGATAPQREADGKLDFKDFDEYTWENFWKTRYALLGWVSANGTGMQATAREVREALDDEAKIARESGERLVVVCDDATITGSRINILLESFTGGNSSINYTFGEEQSEGDARSVRGTVACVASLDAVHPVKMDPLGDTSGWLPSDFAKRTLSAYFAHVYMARSDGEAAN